MTVLQCFQLTINLTAALYSGMLYVKFIDELTTFNHIVLIFSFILNTLFCIYTISTL